MKVFSSYTAAIQQQVLPPLNPTCQGKEAVRERGREMRTACTQRQAVRLLERPHKRGSERSESSQSSCQSKCIESFVYSSLLCKSFTFAIMTSKIRANQTNP